MQKLRYFHRYATIIITVFALFLGVTGTLIQTTDLWSIYGSKPANDPNVRAMREAFDGPGGFVVRTSSDYEAASLPADLDYNASLAAVLGSLKMQPDSTDPLYVEFRMAGQTAVGQVGIEDRHIRFNLANGALLERTMLDKPEEQAPISWRNTFKHLHRMTTFGNWALGINIIVALGLL